MKINKTYLPIIICLSVAIGVLLGNAINKMQSYGLQGNNPHIKKLNKLISYIETDYVDAVQTDSIIDLTVTEILEKLDPHSVYISQKEVDAVDETMKGDFVGIGVQFYTFKDTIAVIKPIANGPSEKAGIKAGDRILFADKFQLYNKKISTETLFSKLKGKENTQTTLIIYRKSENKKIKVTVTRSKIPLKSVDVATMLTDSVGYIKINRFAETTYDEFYSGLEKLKKQGVKELIIDLRDNGGGYLDIATQIADEFLKVNELIVKTINKNGKIDLKKATKKGIYETGKLVVLLNENSASASEVLAGAIQDNDRGTIYGRRSFGKGLVQQEMDLGDGSKVRLTTARYYTPSGRSIQKSYKKGTESYFNDFEKRYSNGELYSADSIKVADSLKFKTKKGRVVYGGGGIIPDVFVPISQKHGEEAITAIIEQSGLIDYFVFEQIDKNRLFYENLSLEELQAEIKNTSKYFNLFQKHVAQSGLDLYLLNKEDFIKTYLYAGFAKQLFNDIVYYQILLPEDLMVQKIIGN